MGVPASVKRPYRRKAIAPAPGDYSISGLSKANPGIKTRAVDGFYVKVGKDANAYQKQNAVASAKGRLNAYAAAEGLPEFEAAVELMKAEMKVAVPMGRLGRLGLAKAVIDPQDILYFSP